MFLATPVYCGRVDNWYEDHSLARPAPARHDLVDALEAIPQGRAVEQSRTTAVGCIVADLSRGLQTTLVL
ncbi:MAG: hypothetical protein CMJ81_24545 [Planctomycetaceae bacterium]|nr:hypothetical protein [Planctomycetaceae bacterium]